MINTLRIARLCFLESILNKVLYGIFAFALVMLGVTHFFTSFISFDVVKVVIDLMLSTVSIGCFMVIFFLCMPGLVNDIREHTIYFVLSSPVKRSEYLIGKFLGFSAILFVSLLLLCTPAILMVKYYLLKYPNYIPQNFHWHKLLIACFFKFFATLVFLSLVFLIWSLLSSGFLVSMASVTGYLISQNIGTVKNIALVSKKIGIVTQNLIKFVSWIFPNLGYFSLNTYASYDIRLPPYYLLKIFAYGVSYILVAIMLSIILLNRREL